MSGSGREALADVREWSGCPPGCQGLVGSPSRMSGSGWEAFRMSGSGWEALPDDQEWSRAPSGCPGVFESPSRMSGRGREGSGGPR